MESFKKLEIPTVLDTSSNNLLEEFFKPALNNSIRYDRGVGFFTSGWLSKNSKSLEQFIINGGQARWITSPILSEDDWEAMLLGDEAKRNHALYKMILASINNLREKLEKDVLSALAWMIADNIIEFKLAVPRNNLSGEFHAKFGIFEDCEGNKISFTGSNNDSSQGFRNFESMMVVKSWIKEHQEIVNQQQNNFSRLWKNLDPNVAVFDLPDAAKENILKLRMPTRAYNIDKRRTSLKKRATENFFNKLSLRNYQENAVAAWERNDYKGIIEMATGTGKTRVAVACILKSLIVKDINIIIISCPQHTILEQWIKDIDEFNIPVDSSIIANSTNANWKIDLQNILLGVKIGIKKNIVIYTLHSTAKSKFFRSKLNEFKDNNKIFFIGDEVHSLGAIKAKNALLDIYDFRLGLSATPKRWFDETGTQYIYDFFGEVVYKFSIKDALINIDPRTGKTYLSPYYYYPIPINLTENELLAYHEFTKKISKLSFNKADEEFTEIIKLLSIHRANIHKNAANKIPSFKQLINKTTNLEGTLLFVSNEQQIFDCQEILDEFNVTYHKFTEHEGTRPQEEFGGISQRSFLIEKFKKREIKVLIAIKCLDEGVDIPNARNAILLASSTNPREYIQRIGRVIRPAENKNFAYIYDFIVVPSLTQLDPILRDLEYKLFSKEMTRVSEIAQNAINNAEAVILIQSFLGS